MSLQNIVAEYIKKPLSGQEIQRLTGVFPILYSDLANYKKLEDVLAVHNKPYAIILYQVSSKTDGHYNAIGVNFEGNPFQFDPYGFPDIKIQQLSPYDKKLPDYITPLLEDYARRKNKKVFINNVDYQSKSGDIADCGRHSGLACIFSQFMKFDDMYQLYFHNASSYLKGDNVATILTLMCLDDIGAYYKNH
jgi:hypothetical protein